MGERQIGSPDYCGTCKQRLKGELDRVQRGLDRVQRRYGWIGVAVL